MATAGCQYFQKTPAAPPSSAETQTTQPVVETPRCETLSEGCAAAAETELNVPSALAFQPPEGWIYANEPTQSVARSKDGGATLAFAAASGDLDDRKSRQKITERLGILLQQIRVSDVDLDALEGRLTKPDTTLSEEGSFDVLLWEVGETHQPKSPRVGDEEGTVLVVVSPTPVGLLLIGVAFVTPAAAAEQAPRIMQSVKSLRLVEPRPETPENPGDTSQRAEDVP